jgi:hypothetical protein
VSTTYLCRVFVSTRRPLHPRSLVAALSGVASTATFHGGGWVYSGTPHAVGALVTFDVGSAGPHTTPGLLRRLRAAIRELAPDCKTLSVELLDADRAAWFSGGKDHVDRVTP